MAHHYGAETIWERGEQPFIDNRYSRGFLMRFDGGIDVAGSSSPHVVPPPLSVECAVDPEEAFVSSLSSCHMLWFLSIAATSGFCIDRYHDRATGLMKKNSAGKLAMATVTLRPEVRFSGNDVPSREDILRLHHLAHEECFLANSVRCEVLVEPRDPAE